MPAVQSGKVLVSGANGYIAVWVIKKLLEQGYSVRGTVRSEKSMPHLQQLFKSFGDKLELVIVPDITKEGAFDEAVKGVDAVAHTASPFHYDAVDPREIIEPAVRGTTSILESLLKYGQQAKRVIILSSVAAVMEASGYTEFVLHTEKDWNRRSVPNCDTLGKEASPIDKYYASKTLAEHAAWEFEAKHKDEIKFDLVALNPPFVHGPFLHEIASPEKLNTSMLSLYNAVIKRTKSAEELTSPAGAWVDVRDISAAHLYAFQKEEAAGERILIHAGMYTWQDWIDTAHKIDSSFDPGVAGYDSTKVEYLLDFDNNKSRSLFGMEYIGMTECMKDILAQLKERGWY